MKVDSAASRVSSAALVALATLALVVAGCPDDTGGGDCPDGQTFDDAQNTCVSGSDTDDGNGNGNGDAGDTSTSDGSTDGSDVYPNGQCKKRSIYVQVYHPNVYVVFDRSASMSGSKMQQAKNGLDRVADKVADRVRIGVSGYPIKSCCCSSRELLELGSHTSQEIKNSYKSLNAAGGTPTGIALYQVQAGDRLTDPDDEQDAQREKAVVLITDGEPNDAEICDNPRDPVEQARKLQQNGVSTYVVGYQSDADPKVLNQIAKAGGTDAPGSNRFYEASSGTQLTQALLDITGSAISCGYKLDPKPPAGSGVNVRLGGEEVPDSGYDFDDSRGQVTLTGSWCDKLRNQAPKGTSLSIDVGCPTCSLAGESCTSAGDCCDGRCSGGVCKEECRTVGSTCSTDGECCSGRCGKSGGADDLGNCVSG